MRKKKIGIALVILLVMAAVLSIRAHAADSPQTVIDADGSGTTISVTDITPREDKAARVQVQGQPQLFGEVHPAPAVDDAIHLFHHFTDPPFR